MFADRARRAGVSDERVLAAVEAVDRRRFVPDELSDEAERDRPVPLPFLQTTSQPSLVALMVEALAPRPHHRVLEVGTGYGYQAALLARLVAEVWTVERWPGLAEAAEQNLIEDGLTNVHVVVGDGADGLPEHAPFDGIVVAAACTKTPPALIDQLRPGGRLVVPVRIDGYEECVVLTKDEDGRTSTVRSLGAVRFVPLVTG